MSYAPAYKRKEGKVGVEKRGSKPRGYNKEVGKAVEETVERVSNAYERQMGKKDLKHGSDDTDISVAIPTGKYNLEVLYDRHSKYSPADKIAAVTAYLVTGSYTRAEKYCGVPAATITNWKKNSEWWPTLTEVVKREKDEEFEAKLTGILHEGSDELIDRIQNGDAVRDTKTGEVVRVPMKGKDLASVMGILFDKRQLQRGAPTSRVERVSTEQRLEQLKSTFESFANGNAPVDAEFTEIKEDN